jgi:hypothetical protein
MTPIVPTMGIVIGCIVCFAVCYALTNKAVDEICSFKDNVLEKAGFSIVCCITKHTILDLLKYSVTITYIVKDKQANLFLATLKYAGPYEVFICKLVPIDKMHAGIFR